MDPVFDIIVLTWKRKDLIRDFVNSFLENTTIPCRLIIIDNASGDGTADYLLSLKDTAACTFTIVLNKENRGFVAGMNQGIGMSTAPYVCLANNDLLFSKGWLDEVLAVLEKYPLIGVLNPNSNNLGEHLHGASIESVAGRLREAYKGVFVEMPFCIGFCMFIRKDVIRKVGGLSDEFRPMFFEDTDYSLKASRAGYLIGLAKGSFVWHKEHASFTPKGQSRQDIFEQSRRAFHKKWGVPLRIAWVLGPGQLAAHLDAGISLARAGNQIWFILPDLAKKRDEIFSRQGLIDHSGIRFIRSSNRLTTAWYVLVKKKKFDYVIADDTFLLRLFAAAGYTVSRRFDQAVIDTAKMAGIHAGA